MEKTGVQGELALDFKDTLESSLLADIRATK